MFKKIQIKSMLVGLLALPFVFAACNGGKTSGGGDSGKEGQFVSTDSTSGTIALSVKSTSLPIGGTAGFFATVKDVNGAPVNGLRIACDSEVGLALIEPTTGFELTDGFGNMSGVVGCEAPGSFQLACRLPVGGNKRQFATIICTGDVPSDFTGFPGAGGGGLGGGVDTTDSQDDDFSVRISGINFYDSGNTTSATTSIDTSQGTCGTSDPEPFFDSMVGFELVNNTSSVVRIESFTYTVANFDGAGNSYTSSRIFFLGEAKSVDPNGGATEVVGLFIEATSGGAKRFFGRSDTITSLGFKNITFNVRGITSAGETVNITATAAVSFNSFNRC